jgi:hypothetical protein
VTFDPVFVNCVLIPLVNEQVPGILLAQRAERLDVDHSGKGIGDRERCGLL